MNPERHTFHTKLSLGLTVVTLFGLLLLSWIYSEPHDISSASAKSGTLQQQQQQQQQHTLRFLNEDQNDDDDAAQNDDSVISDYTGYSCNNLFNVVPDRGEAQCQFAKTCNQGNGVWSTWVFCSSYSLEFTVGVLSPFILVWMIILFRLLGSTAEDYFSPALEMLANKLGLPPRFAGVTLLALGNGAADVSATVSAITNDPEHGYLLSLGALTGAAMVISTVVSALVVLVAGGVPCRGALVRDVAALGISVIIVWNQLGGASGEGVVGPDTVTFFLSFYAFFVLLVLCADVYHRAVVLPRRQLRAQEAERQRQLLGQQLHEQEINTGMMAAGGGAAPETMESQQQQQQQPMMIAGGADTSEAADDSRTAPSQRMTSGNFSKVLTAFSNYDNDNDIGEGWGAGGGVESEELAQDRPIMLHGSQGILSSKSEDQQQQQQQQHQGDPDESGLLGDTAYTVLEDAGHSLDRTCINESSPGIAASPSWHHAFQTAAREVMQHADEVWDDIAYNGDIDILTKTLLILEVPFVALRKLTVSIPCEGFYVRGLIALSMAISPFWMGFYLWYSNGLNGFGSVFFWCYCGICVVAAGALMRYAPGGDGSNISLWAATPVALYGFVIAATWIDLVADSLVQLLDFIGIVLRIPGPVVGLTILAWGNSMADLSADVTMARKGLANMAMTACFAGPFFNILVGLGLGFSTLAGQTGQAERNVHLQPAISVGFWYLAANSVVILITGLGLGNGKIPKKYGYIALFLYILYLAHSLGLQYFKKGDDEL